MPPIARLLSPPTSQVAKTSSPIVTLSSVSTDPSVVSPSTKVASPTSRAGVSPFFGQRLLAIFGIPFAVGLTKISSQIFLELSTYTFPHTSTVTSTGLTGGGIVGEVAGARGLWVGRPYRSLAVR